MEIKFENTDGSLTLDPNPKLNDNLESTTELRLVRASDANPAGSLMRLNGAIKGQAEKAEFSFSSGLEFEVINENNPHKVRVPKDDGSDSSNDDFLPPYPWSHTSSMPAAIAYRLFAEVNGKYRSGEFPLAAGAKASFGLEAGSRIECSYIVAHGGSEEIGDCVDSDLSDGSFLYSRSAAKAADLEPGGEFLLTRYQGSFAFEANATWGQVFRSDPGLIQSVFPGGKPIGFELGTDEEVVELGLGANAGLGVQFDTGLELVASVVKEGTKKFSKLAFRKASRASTTASIEFNAHANIPDTTSSLKALAQMIALRTDVSATISEIEKALKESREKIESIRNTADLADSYLKDWTADQIEAAKKIGEEWISKLNVSLNDWISMQDRFIHIDDAVEEAAKYYGLEDQVDTIKRDLLERVKLLETSKLPDETNKLLQSILTMAGFKGHSSLSLASLLSVSHFRETVQSAIPEATNELLDSLRVQVLQVARNAGIWTMFQGDKLDFLKMIEESTDLSLPAILASFETQQILRDLAPTELIVSADELLEKVADELEDIVDEAEDIVEWIGGKVFEFPERLDAALARIAAAIPKQIEFSAKLEYERIKENENLLELEYDLSDGGFENAYDSLVAGNWQKILDAYDPDNPGPFRKLEFYAVQKITTRKSFTIQLLKGKFSQEAFETSNRVTNISGRSKYDFLTEGRWEVKHLNPKKRHWKGYSRLVAEGLEFVDAEYVRGDAFDFHYEAAMSLSGKVDPHKKGKRKTVRENWELFRILSMMIDHATDNAQSIYHVAEDCVDDGTEELTLDVVFRVEAPLWDKLWKLVPEFKLGKYDADDGRLVAYYLAIWPELKKARNILNSKENPRGFTGAEEKNFNDYFRRFARLTERVEEMDSIESLFKGMKKWRWATNRAASADDKLDKLGYPLSLLANVPENGEGWSLSAILTIDGNRYYFG